MHLVAVNVALYIVPTIDGSITLKAEVPFHAGVSYEKGKGVNGTMGLRNRLCRHQLRQKEKWAYISGQRQCLLTMKSIPLLDAELDMGAEADGNEQADQMDRYVLMLISTSLFLRLELAMRVSNIRIRSHFFAQ
ncbi:MAG: hypothetical protein V8S21_12250 [Lachnospira eligens]